MLDYVHSFLKIEVTFISKLLQLFVGKYYDNTLSNAASWMFFTWNLVHLVFELGINAILRKMRYKEYVRLRLKKSLWYLGFYGCSFLYCSAVLFHNGAELLSYRVYYIENIADTGQFLLSFIVLSTFYAHSAIWEYLRGQNSYSVISYLFLAVFLCFSHVVRCFELALSLTAIIGASQAAVEIARCVATLEKNHRWFTVAARVLFVISVCLSILTHLFAIPMLFVIPILYRLLSNPSFTWTILNVSLWAYLSMEIINSPLFKLSKHKLQHTFENQNNRQCPGFVLECSLFLPRDDVAHNLTVLKQEIKEREAKMMSMRKPKNRSMLIQTLKCMMVLRRKLAEKQRADSSESDDSEKSDSKSSITEVTKEQRDEKSGSESEDLSDLEEDDALLKKNDLEAKKVLNGIIGAESSIKNHVGREVMAEELAYCE